jgi:LysM repeat protein
MRANSMGSGFSTIADDAFSIFYNPAGLTQIKDWEVGSTFNRRLSDKDLGEFSIGYVRPIPDTKDTVFGFGYDGIRQSSKGKMDSYIFGYSNRATLKYFQMPVLYGGNFRIMSIRYPYESHLGIGVDAGIILSTFKNYRTSLVLSRLMMGMGGIPLGTITIGNSYTYGDTTFVMDLRVNNGVSRFFPGVERKFYDDLLRIRLGKGINIDNNKFLMIGAGINFDPVIIDIGLSYPWKGLNQNTGSYGFSLTYKFTGTSYKERMLDDASNKVKELNIKVDDLTKQANQLQNETARYNEQKGILESEVTLLNTRKLELDQSVKNAEMELIDMEYQKKKPVRQLKEKEEIKAIKKEDKWPKVYKVETGDTLRSISSKYYGTPNMWKIIYDENQDKIYKGLPKEGEILVIPPPKKED